MTKKKNTDYPEHEKLRKIEKESQAIGAFIEWAIDKKLIGIRVKFTTINKVLADYFDIDLNKLEQEKQDILKTYLVNNDTKG